MPDVIAPPTPAAAAVAGGGRFPVRRIYCVGRNYADHAREMGGDPTREAPFFFSKPADALVAPGADIAYPPATSELHHEVELVLALGSGGEDLSPEAAGRCIFGYAVGCDLTRRDLQAQAKAAGRPWDMAKGFDSSAPCGPIRPMAEAGDLAAAAIALSVDGEPRQAGRLAEMIWPPAELLAELSRYVRLTAGDLVFTGTPSGVGPVRPGQTVSCRIDGLDPLDFRIVARGWGGPAPP